MPFDYSRLDAEKLLKAIGVKKNNKVVDFGIGPSAHFVLTAAKIIGEGGHVYAVDIISEVVKMFDKRCALERISNATGIWGDYEGHKTIAIESDSVDFVLAVHNLWCTKDLGNMAKEARRLLKTGGKFVIVDWKPEAPHPISPASEMCTNIYAAKQGLIKSGFESIEEFEVDSDHWGLVLIKGASKT